MMYGVARDASRKITGNGLSYEAMEALEFESTYRGIFCAARHVTFRFIRMPNHCGRRPFVD